MTKIKLPNSDRRAFHDWDEYGETYRVDVDLGANTMTCRGCAAVWPIPHYRGKLARRAHVCPEGCNGKPRARSGGKHAPAVVEARQRAMWEEKHGWKDWGYEGPEHYEISGAGPRDRSRSKLWLTFRQAGKRPQLSTLLHDLAEHGAEMGDDSFLDVLDAYW